jgi:hypothetical protein
MATRIQNRRDTAANWTTNNPTLADGEIGFETDTGLFKIGANNTVWTSLSYAQVAGPAGPVGEVGPVGAVGEQGAPGINGANGENGINGLSAYEIWINQGNSGTEQDFIDSLAGEDGVAGVDGLNGANGAAGANGLGYDLQVPAVYAGRSAFGPLVAKVSWNPSFGTKAFVVGSRVRATLISDPTKYVEGTLTTFNYLPDGGVEETYYGVYFYNDIDTTGYGIFDELGTFDGSDTWKISVAGEVGAPANIQQLVLSYGASSPNTNSGNWTNNAGTPSVSGTLGFPDQYSQQFTIEKTSETSVIEINFDAVFDIAFNQNLGWGSS